jgi:hypothetical protein
MTRHFALMLLGLVAAVPATAETMPALENAATLNTPQWTTCFVLDRAAGKKWVSGIFEGSAARPVDEAAWIQYVRSKFAPSADIAGGCSVETTREDALWRHAVFTDEDPLRPTFIVAVADWSPPFERRVDFQEPSPDLDAVAVAEESDLAIEPPASASVVAEATTQQPVALHGARIADEAEFQRQYAEYQARLAEQQRQVEAFNQAQLEVARRKEQQRLAAAKAVAAYAVELHAHEEVVRRHDADAARRQATIATTAAVER